MLLEEIAYGIARGVVRAYLDVLTEAQHVTPEKPTELDLARRDKFRAAIAASMHPPGRVAGSEDPASGGGTGVDLGVGK